MQVILKEDVQKLGRAGETVKVADGYGRNFLLPKKLAVVATPANMKRLEQELNSKKGQAKRQQLDAQYLADAIQAKPVVIKMASGEAGKLFGSVTSTDIEKALTMRNITIDKRKIELDEPIKTLGQFEVTIKVHADVSAKLVIVVEDEKQQPEEAAPVQPEPNAAVEPEKASSESTDAIDEQDVVAESSQPTEENNAAQDNAVENQPTA